MEQGTRVVVTGTLNLKPLRVSKRTQSNHLIYAHSFKTRHYEYTRFRRVRLNKCVFVLNLIHGAIGRIGASFVLLTLSYFSADLFIDKANNILVTGATKPD